MSVKYTPILILRKDVWHEENYALQHNDVDFFCAYEFHKYFPRTRKPFRLKVSTRPFRNSRRFYLYWSIETHRTYDPATKRHKQQNWIIFGTHPHNIDIDLHYTPMTWLNRHFPSRPRSLYVQIVEPKTATASR